MSTKKNYLLDLDWFDSQFIAGFLPANHKIKEFLNEYRYTIGDESISSRVLKHWHDEGIIDDNRVENKGWRKFSISEIIWISIVVKLRRFGVDLKKIKKVKHHLDLYNTEVNQSKCPLLDFYIFYSTTSSMPVKLLVFDNGDAVIGRQLSIDTAVQFETIDQDYISIDIPKLINERFKEKKIGTDYLNYSFSKVEKELHRSIYFDDIKTLEVKINDDSYLLTKEYIRDNQDEIMDILKVIGSHNEESIVRNGKGKYYKLIERKKIR
jgi:DNA-binding transcriptional MerR regulator